MPEKHLKLNLRSLLDQHSLSITQFAEKTGMTYVTVHAIVNGKYKRIGLETLEKMCKALKCDIGDLFIWE